LAVLDPLEPLLRPLGLSRPLGVLRDAAWTAEQLGRSALGQERLRVAVTGLSRSGKTVFITSLLANLLAAGQGKRALPALEAASGGRLRHAKLVPAVAQIVPRFDLAGHLSELAADPPAWPGRTEDLSTVELTLTLGRASWIGGGLLGDRTVTLELLDYPGEWLLDLPMLSQDYAGWSAATLARLRRGPRAAVCAEFLAFADALPAAAPAEEALARRGFALYRDALRACRDDLGMRLLQPGRALNPGPRGEAPILWFFPLPHADDGGGLAGLLRQRFDAYLADQRESFFEPYFRRFRRQTVLVDVLGALHAGQAAFEDTADALAAIAKGLREEESWFDRLLGVGPERVAFAATKADHVPSRQRDALAALLGALVGTAPGTPSSVHVLASVRCTEDDVATLDGRPVAAVRGVLLENGRSARIYPGEVPLRPPEPGYWQHGFFRMPEFQPPRLDPAGATGVPHLGLDTLLARLIGDLL
jgi:hypothetical protein